MKKKATIFTILIIVSAIQLFGCEFRIIKGKVVDNKNEILIGARIEEYGNGVNYIESDINGEFEIVVEKTEKEILRVTYGCSAFYEVLYKVELEDKYVRIEAFTKKVNKNTKKIRRNFRKLEKKDETFYIRLNKGVNTENLAIRSQIIKFGLLFPDWNDLKITAYHPSEKYAKKRLDLVENELLKINSRLKIERAIILNKEENFDTKIVKVKFKKEGSHK